MDPSDIDRGYVLNYLEPEDLLINQAGNFSPQEPTDYTIHNSGEYYGEAVVELGPPPNQARTYDFTFEVSARPFTLNKNRDVGGSGNTVAANGTTTITGSGTNFTSKMVGAIIRFPLTGVTVPPSGLDLGLDEDQAGYDEQRTIMAVASTTSLTVDSAVTTRTGCAYSISDPIDIDPAVMGDFFLAECEARYAKIARQEGFDTFRQTAEAELREAMVADNRRTEFSRRGRNRRLYDLADWAIAETTVAGSQLTD